MTEQNEPNEIHYSVTTTIRKSRILDMFTTLLDSSAVRYWVRFIDATLPDGFDLNQVGWLTPDEREDWQKMHTSGVSLDYFAPLVGGSWEVVEYDDDTETKHVLDGDVLARGMKCFIDTEPGHFADFISEQDDASTADAFLQCCLFGKQVYG
jgi:hypothetical protein